MPIRNARPLNHRPKGCSDAIDGTNAFPGAMQQLSNLVPALRTRDQWEPRPARAYLANFFPFHAPGFVSTFLVVGNLAYGMIATSRFPGRDEPFVCDLTSGAFIPVTGASVFSTPLTQPTIGNWTPPVMAAFASKVIVTHPGFPGDFRKFGYFDTSGFVSSGTIGLTGNTTAGSPTITNLSGSPVQAGYRVGMLITDNFGDFLPGTAIGSIDDAGMVLVVTNPSQGSNNGAQLTVTGGTPAAPLWAAADLLFNPLPSTPVGVGYFNGRAYFACGTDGLPFSDPLDPTVRTNANQVLTTGDGLAVTAVAGLPLNSPITGGIIQSLIAFEGASAMRQITGDPTSMNLSMNLLNVATGTLAPLSICPTTLGLAFVSPEGLRIIDFNAHVSDPIGEGGEGVCVPMINALAPSRISAGANADTIRVSLQNAVALGQPYQEWWFHIPRKTWSGPHTLKTSIIQPWTDPEIGTNTFVVAAQDVPAMLYRSDSYVSGSSDFEEAFLSPTTGVTVDKLGWSYMTCLLPDNNEMSMNAIVESTLGMVLPGDQEVTITAMDEAGEVLDVQVIPGRYTLPTWGANLWGSALWYAVQSFFHQFPIKWSKPLVFKQFFVLVEGKSFFGLTVGNLYLRYQQLGYMLEEYPLQPLAIRIPALPGNTVDVSGTGTPVIEPQALVVSTTALLGTLIGTAIVTSGPNVITDATLTLTFDEFDLFALNGANLVTAWDGTVTPATPGAYAAQIQAKRNGFKTGYLAFLVTVQTPIGQPAPPPPAAPASPSPPPTPVFKG